MALSLAFAGVALFLAEMGTGHERAGRFLGRDRKPRRAVRKVCAGCERQRALFRCHGFVKWDRYHTLCGRCFRAQRVLLVARACRPASEQGGEIPSRTRTGRATPFT
jgi:hypothetical protein